MRDDLEKQSRSKYVILTIVIFIRLFTSYGDHVLLLRIHLLFNCTTPFLIGLYYSYRLSPYLIKLYNAIPCHSSLLKGSIRFFITHASFGGGSFYPWVVFRHVLQLFGYKFISLRVTKPSQFEMF